MKDMNIKNKVFFFTAFSAGYYLRTHTSGIKPLLLAILFMSLDYILVQLIVSFLKRYKNDYRFAEIKRFIPDEK